MVEFELGLDDDGLSNKEGLFWIISRAKVEVYSMLKSVPDVPSP